jgi:hypothetical protein
VLINTTGILKHEHFTREIYNAPLLFLYSNVEIKRKEQNTIPSSTVPKSIMEIVEREAKWIPLHIYT